MESVIGRFESAWRMGGRPSIEDFLDDAPDQRGALLVELAHAELELRLRAGERARVEEYLTRFPELERDPAIVAELIRAEFELRRRDDANVDAAEYRARFPKLSDALPTRATPPPQRPARFPLRFNCPHCRNPIEVVAIDRDEEMICPSCGSSFRLDSDLTQSWNKDRLPALGRFELIEAVGRGAFGTVYRARDMQLQRMVAVKVPRSGHLTTDEDEDRFVKEARNAAQLKHPGIVQVYEVGHSDTFPYIVSELVEGITLADALTGRRFGFRESADLVAQVANALEHAHKQGVVHRDLKPSNIMLTAEGVPRVMDFGLAKRDAGEITVTVDGQVLGTPAYMSPEQASGQAHHVDGRSDVYSLGVILYEMLTGGLPFRGNQRMLLHQVLHDEPRALRSLDDRIPRDLEIVTLKCLEKEPANRYQTAQELAEELKRWLRGEAIAARAISGIERWWRGIRRNPLPAALGAMTVAFSLLAITATALVFVNDAWTRESEAKKTAVRQMHEAEAAQRRASEARLTAEAARRRAEEQEALSRAAQATAETARHAAELAEAKARESQAHLERALQVLGTDEPMRSDEITKVTSKANALAIGGNWQEAADTYRQVVERSGRSWTTLWRWSMLQLSAEDEVGYRATCAELIEKHSKTNSAYQAYWIATTCILGPDAVADMDAVVALAQQAVDADSLNPVARATLGAAQFRAGHYDHAIATLRQASALHPAAALAHPDLRDIIRVSRVLSETILALAYHAQHDRDSTAEQVAFVKGLLNDLQKSPPNPATQFAPWAVMFTKRIVERELAHIASTGSDPARRAG